MLKKVLLLMLAVLALPLFAEPVRWSDLQKNMDSWIEGPAGLLLTGNEKDIFKKLKSPEEKMQFVKIFWQRRDPILRTTENEFKQEFYQRVDYANLNYAEGQNPGWKSARGQAYILFGAPSRIDTQSIPDSSRPAQLWVYDKPPSKELPVNEALMFVYRDFKYVMAPPNPQPGDSIGQAQRQIDSGFRYQDIPSLVQQAFADVAAKRVIDEKKNYDRIFSVETTEKFQLAGIPFDVRVDPGAQTEVSIQKEDAPVYDAGERSFAEFHFKQELRQGDRVVTSAEDTNAYDWSAKQFADLERIVVPLKKLQAPAGQYELWVTVQDRVSMVSETRKISVTY